jgi:hypothetical protein
MSAQAVGEVESFATKLFHKINPNIDVNVSDHMNQRTDERSVTAGEVIKMLKQLHKKYGKKIANMIDTKFLVKMGNIYMPVLVQEIQGKIKIILKTVIRTDRDYGKNKPEEVLEV